MGRQRGATGLSPRARARLRPTRPTGDPAPVPAREPSARAEFVAGPEDLVALVGEKAAAGGPSRTSDDAEESGRHRRVPASGRSWVRLPVALAGARWQPGRAAVAGVVGVALLAALVLGVRVAWARSSAAADVVAPGGPEGVVGVESAAAPVGLPAATTAAAPAGGGPSPAVSGTVVVHVVGEVREPGVRRLAPGARVAEALAAAGGATDEADLAAVNLARVLVDGEQVRVPTPGEALPSPAPDAGGPGGASGGLLPLNSADVPALETLPGVGPVLAQRIVDWRSAHGGFSTVDELAEVSGIGEKLVAELRPLVTT